MAAVRKGQLVKPGSWAKHMGRTRGDKQFWPRERHAEKREIEEQMNQDFCDFILERALIDYGHEAPEWFRQLWWDH